MGRRCLTPTHRHLYYHALSRPGVRKETEVVGGVTGIMDRAGAVIYDRAGSPIQQREGV